MSDRGYTQRELDEIAGLLGRIEPVLQLAMANFPESTEIRLETVGRNPSAALTVSPYIVERICELARRAVVSASVRESV